MSTSHYEFFGKLNFSCEKYPRLITILPGGISASLLEPCYSSLDMISSLMSLDLFAKLVEIVSKLSSIHDFATKLCSIFDRNNIFRGFNPLLKSLFEHDSVDHVSNSLKLVSLTIRGPYSHCLLSLLLTFKSV
jgi:hypothetical protein